MKKAALSLNLDEKNPEAEYVRVYPQYNDNWRHDDDTEPISIEMKVLGAKAQIGFLERLQSGQDRRSKRQRSEAYWKALRSKLSSACRPGSLRGVEGCESVEDLANHPNCPQDLLSELLELAEDLSTLRSVSEEVYEEYRAELKDSDEPMRDDEIAVAVDHERLSDGENEEGN